MKKLLVLAGLSVLMLALAAPVFCGEPEDKGSGYGRGHGHMMGPGYGRGMHGSGWGMPEGGGHMHGRGCGMGPSHQGWKSMKPEQRQKWEKMWSGYQMETLELRKQLATKQMELETLWAQPDMDQTRVQKLSDEVAQLQAELTKKRDKYLLQCRREFGDQGWSCPGGWH